MPDIQEANCFEFTVQILFSPPPLGAPRGGGAKKISPPIDFFSVNALNLKCIRKKNTMFLNLYKSCYSEKKSLF